MTTKKRSRANHPLALDCRLFFEITIALACQRFKNKKWRAVRGKEVVSSSPRISRNRTAAGFSCLEVLSPLVLAFFHSCNVGLSPEIRERRDQETRENLGRDQEQVLPRYPNIHWSLFSFLCFLSSSS